MTSFDSDKLLDSPIEKYVDSKIRAVSEVTTDDYIPPQLMYKTFEMDEAELPESDTPEVDRLWKEYTKFSNKKDDLKAFGCLEKILVLEPKSYGNQPKTYRMLLNRNN